MEDGHLAGNWRLTPEQRDLLRKQIDARVRERLSERGERRIASPGGYAPKLPKPAKP